MEQLKEAFVEAFGQQKPAPGEIWWVLDSKVVLTENARKDKGARPVLVVCCKTLCDRDDVSTVNVVPVSSQVEADLLTFPLRGAMVGEETLNNKSHALMNWYQPIEAIHFRDRHCKIDETSYQAIVNIICEHVVGFIGFDL